MPIEESGMTGFVDFDSVPAAVAVFTPAGLYKNGFAIMMMMYDVFLPAPVSAGIAGKWRPSMRRRVYGV